MTQDSAGRRGPARAAMDLLASTRTAIVLLALIAAVAVIGTILPDPAARESEMIAAASALMPFAEGRLIPVAEPEAVWDDDVALEEPSAGEGWPGEVDIRLGTKQPLYRLDRAGVAGLGFEGEILLGWRGGDAIAADLA